MKKQINYKKVFAIKKQNEQRILKLNPKISERSGIYIFTRYENGFKFAYIGQAKNLLQRTAEHLSGYQYIDNSIRKHKLFSDENPTGWDLNFIECKISELDMKEQEYILKYSNLGYQMRNLTTGSQNEGKSSIFTTETKGYNQGLKKGYEKARKDLQSWFKYLKVEPLKDGKLNERMLQRFNEFIKGE